MLKTKMSEATDILLEQMGTIRKLANSSNAKDKELLQDAIITSKTLNGSASNIIKEAAILLAIEQYSNAINSNAKDIMNKLGISYEK